MASRPKDEARESRISSAVFALLCGWLAFGVLVYGAVDTGTIAILTLFTAVIVLLWLVESWRKKELSVRPSVLILPMLGWATLAVIQLLPLREPDLPAGALNIPAAASISLDPYATRFFLMRLVICIVFFAAMLTFVNSRKRQLRLTVFIVIFGAVTAFFGILQWLAKPDSIYGLRPTPQALPFGPYVNQHHFAALMEMTIGLTLGILFGGKIGRDKKPILMIAAALMTIAVVLTGSRGGMISLLGVLVVLLIGRYMLTRNERSSAERSLTDRGGRFGRAAAWIAPVVLIAAVVIVLGGGNSLFRALGIETNDADFTSGRLHYWQTGWQVFLSHPIIGAGFDAFGVAYTKFDTANGFFRVEQAHNDYLQTLADAGVVGFICLASFIYLFFRESTRSLRDSDGSSRAAALGALAGCVGIFIHSFFDFPLRTPGNAFVFLALVTIAVTSFGKASETERSSHRHG
jgi:O-antigen ligase